MRQVMLGALSHNQVQTIMTVIAQLGNESFKRNLSRFALRAEFSAEDFYINDPPSMIATEIVKEISPFVFRNFMRRHNQPP
jgi:hypothetical protein